MTNSEVMNERFSVDTFCSIHCRILLFSFCKTNEEFGVRCDTTKIRRTLGEKFPSFSVQNRWKQTYCCFSLIKFDLCVHACVIHARVCVSNDGQSVSIVLSFH
jgi:hypothetical protein